MVVTVLDEILERWLTMIDRRRRRGARIWAVGYLELVLLQTTVNVLRGYMPQLGGEDDGSEEEED